MSNKKSKKIIDGFRDIPKTDKTIWSTDQFGKRKVIDLETFTVISKIDNGILATEFKKGTELRKSAEKEYKRRLELQVKSSVSAKRYFRNKTRRYRRSRNLNKTIKKMPIKKVQKIYLKLLHDQKTKKSSKK
tara:strand:- start:8 stop:403 length:396 start_codon:yes stop_codon:yes gene_type:complete